jgi:hypothetical protein
MGAPGLDFQTWETTNPSNFVILSDPERSEGESKDLRLFSRPFNLREHGCPRSGFSDLGNHEPKSTAVTQRSFSKLSS